MSRIAEFGDEILNVQTRLGLTNPGNWNPGLSQSALLRDPLLSDVPLGSELLDLFAWRNGVVSNPNIPMDEVRLTCFCCKEMLLRP